MNLTGASISQHITYQTSLWLYIINDRDVRERLP